MFLQPQAIVLVVPSSSFFSCFLPSVICNQNSVFINERRERDDYSVHRNSFYMFIDEETFDDLVTLHGLPYSGASHPPAPFKPKEGSIDKLITDDVTRDILLKSLSSSLGDEEDINPTNKNNYFVVYGIVDLINLEYSIEHYQQAPVNIECYVNVQWRFSTQEVIDNLSEDQLNDIGEVIRYIDQNGLCLEEEYETGICSKRVLITDVDSCLVLH